ncbi:hypothetical protein DEU56DRAFT_138122 [Suillus clintonianus]|uniref:uncharacterized protein n=1 Tax=Suillus clintonianus TaxID=1904413 RepID=UPI001B863243|nr:uncharacterized protein DEU56DRAFT_138122 [Suillus clintonianus]KAG2118625.1 hypothetical protein DEU56DRAFT_138122 [Suillus clintonianus]
MKAALIRVLAITKIPHSSDDMLKSHQPSELPGQSRGPPKSDARSIAGLTTGLLNPGGGQIGVVTSASADGKKRVLSNEELDMLLDRRETVITNRKKGWKSEEDGAEKGVAFTVYEAPVHRGNA